MGRRTGRMKRALRGDLRRAPAEPSARPAGARRGRPAAGHAGGRRRVPARARGARHDLPEARPAALASRPDLLPDVYIEELGKLVDEVPPFPFAEVERIVREDLGADAVARLEPEPLAAASIAQIHQALLKDGRDVVVKVRRPGIVEQVELDLDVIRSTVGFLEERSETAQLLQLRALAEELEVPPARRARLRRGGEQHRADRRVSSRTSRISIVPQVIRPHVTERVLVLERIHGEKVVPGHGLSHEAGREPCPRLLPRLHPAGHPRRRLPRRPAPRERAPD